MIYTYGFFLGRFLFYLPRHLILDFMRGDSFGFPLVSYPVLIDAAFGRHPG